MKNLHFITRTSHGSKIRSFLGVCFLIIILVALGIVFSTFWYYFIQHLPGLSWVVEYIKQEVASVTLSGLFYAHLLGGLFFVPSPDEIIFYYALMKGNTPHLALIVATAGYMVAQIINYVLGRKLSGPILTIVSKEKVYKFRRFTNAYGGLTVFVFNVLPFPAPLLTLALGIAKYNFYRLMFWTTLGKVIKYGAIAAFYLWIT